MNASSLSASCFGKLPAFGDFIRHNTNSQGIQVLDKWVQEGLYLAKNYLGQRWESIYNSATPYCFIYPLPELGQYYAGILKPSRDRGNRKYPFMVFTTIDVRQLSGQQHLLLPLMLKPFFNTVLEQMMAWEAEKEMQQVTGSVGALSVSLMASEARNTYDNYVQKATVGQFWDKHLQSVGEDKKYLVFRNLTEIIRPLRGRDVSRINLGLRFPFRIIDDDFVSDICVWQNMVINMLGQSASFLPALFWTIRPYETVHFYSFFRRPVAKIFIGLLHAAWDDDVLCKMETSGRRTPEEARQALSGNYRELLEKRQHNLQFFLNNLRY